MNRILIAEDEPGIAAFLEKGLRAAGFTTLVVADGYSATAMARDSDFDLLILDLGLPRQGGHDVLAEVRGRGEKLPIVILTARTGIGDTVAGLDGGADDYITKPFRFEELLARVKARLRTRGTPDLPVLDVDGIRLNLKTRRVEVEGREVELSAREFLLAETLIGHQGQVLSREILLSRVWGYDFDPGSNVVDVYVGYLRKKLGKERIETIRGMGYRFR